ncbi:[Protein-PII] uridylyltransferase / [Protein-PII]-UMP uridylyl-removing enzyme [hydrothermal vent metagenome]|uniref:[Protein-PII] uridylyltransferase / [Protein-PII]-UMP uridylyl-removing enzyme n=1 Tax=hydrothermal vent metagenome TaxID=652676 RepID=A0A3B0WJ31_9ZZZZ
MNTIERDTAPFIQALNCEKTSYPDTLKRGRALLKTFLDHQFTQYENGISVSLLIKKRSLFIDQLLETIWNTYLPSNIASLIAVGGYGREELHPYSDIDLLILCNDIEQHQDNLSKFITILWDLGFDVGSAIRTVKDCFNAGLEDVTTATNILESRWITGNKALFEQLQSIWNHDDFWSSKAFFQAKYTEQENRHKRFNDTVYQLEPNIKESPGGLRDVQTIYWIAKRHFNASSINELVQKNFLSAEEFIEIEAAYQHLNRIRFALQHLKRRREDRLQFDLQQSIAESFGYVDNDKKMAVEQFMSSYYRNVHSTVKLNEILLQHFREILFDDKKQTESINMRFNIVNQHLDIKDPNIFKQNPTTLLEVFIILETRPHITGLRSKTIRAIRDHLYLIDDNFRQDPINIALFIEIFRQPKGVNAAVKRMHGYGILAAYLPAFKKISGLMQFNIFHAYTVDEHTVLVIRNLRRFFIDEFTYEFPTAHQIATQLSKPEVLFLAGLFHDIAKGRGGKHEILGAQDALEFAKQHNLAKQDQKMLHWLVRNHLVFSGTAQRKDLSDPQVIKKFADLMQNQTNLDYLYLLTVADVCSTSDAVWNDWKNALFLVLYNETSSVLSQAENIPKDRAKKALKTQEKAKELLTKKGLLPTHYQPFWNSMAQSEFFSRQNAQDVARITQQIHAVPHDQTHIFLQKQKHLGATELVIYMQDRDFLFAHITHALDLLNLTVVEARIFSTNDQMTLVVMYILNRENMSYLDQERYPETTQKIQAKLAQTDIENHSHQGTTQARRIRCFETPTELVFNTLNEHRTELHITTKDIPGLLSKIGHALKRCNIRLHDAKIHTVGEKAEDVFIISDTHNKAIKDQHSKEQFSAELIDLIE